MLVLFCFSLVVDNKTSDEPMETDVIEEDESTVNYESFREKRPKTSWSELGRSNSSQQGNDSEHILLSDKSPDSVNSNPLRFVCMLFLYVYHSNS